MEIFFSFLAGILTSVNPCVLPLLPIIIVNAMNKNKYGPIFMCIGLCITYIASSYIFGQLFKLVIIDPRVVHNISAVFIIIFGVFLIVPTFWARLNLGFSGAVNYTNKKINKLSLKSPLSFILLGGLLGVIWSPCAGPILGEALFILTVANFDAEMFTITARVLIPFVIGASLPILLVAYSGKYVMGKFFHKILSKAAFINIITGLVLIIYGGLILTGYLRFIESLLLDIMPFGWISFSSQF